MPPVTTHGVCSFRQHGMQANSDCSATTVVSVPIGVDYDRIQYMAADASLPGEQRRLRDLFDLRADIVGVGVDRLDYTKGIPERLAALDAALTRRPDLRGRLTFIQIGVPSRSELHSYAEIEAEINHRVHALNARHAVPGGAPVVCYYKSPLRLSSLVALSTVMTPPFDCTTRSCPVKLPAASAVSSRAR